jgi:hypothetical protein
MTQQNDMPAIVNISPAELRETIIVSIEGQDWIRPFSAFNISFQSTESEILEAIAPAILEDYGTDIKNYYKVRKAVNSQNIHVIPTSVAGI